MNIENYNDTNVIECLLKNIIPDKYYLITFKTKYLKEMNIDKLNTTFKDNELDEDENII